MLPKRLLALTLFAALAVMPVCGLRAQWVQTNGPYNLSISCMAANGTDLFLGIQNTGIFGSTDLGKSWTTGGGYGAAIAISDSAIFSGDFGGLLRSTDSGASWVPVDDVRVQSIATHGSNVFVSSEDGSGFNISTDNGLHWTAGTAGGDLNILFAPNDSTLLGGSQDYGCLFRLTDSSNTWEETLLDTGITSNNINAFAQIGQTLFAGTTEGVIFSTDDGKSWIVANTGLTSRNVVSLAVAGASLFAGTDQGVFQSTDNGANWVSTGSQLNWITVSTLATIGADLFAGTPCGVFMSSNNGTNWTPASIGLPITSDVSTLAFVNGNVYAGFDDGVVLSTDSGSNWLWSGDGLNSSISALAVIGTNIFAGTYTDSIFLSKDGGKNWNLSNEGFGNYNYADYVAGFAQSDSNLFAWTNNSYYYTNTDYGGGSIYLSTNNGQSWTMLNSENVGVTAFTLSGSDLFTGGNNGKVFFSSNAGSTWKDIQIGLTDTTITALATIGTNLFAATKGDGIFFSPDNGTTWGAVNNGLPDHEWIRAMAVSGNSLFAATNDSGIFLSTDNGESWMSIGLDNIANYGLIQTLAVNGSDIFAGVVGYINGGDGVWRRPLSDFGISSVAQTPVVGTPTIQIYPNPFSQSTQITFTSQAAGYAEVSVVNMLGVEVARLFSGELGVGEHSFLWSNPTGLPDGTYECLVRMNGQVQTLPVVKK